MSLSFLWFGFFSFSPLVGLKHLASLARHISCIHWSVNVCEYYGVFTPVARLLWPKSVDEFVNFNFFPWFGLFSHRGKSKWTLSEPKCVTTSHLRMFSFLIGWCVWGGSTKVNTRRRCYVLDYLREFKFIPQLVASLYRPLHIYTNSLHPRTHSIRGYGTFF